MPLVDFLCPSFYFGWKEYFSKWGDRNWLIATEDCNPAGLLDQAVAVGSMSVLSTLCLAKLSSSSQWNKWTEFVRLCWFSSCWHERRGEGPGRRRGLRVSWGGARILTGGGRQRREVASGLLTSSVSPRPQHRTHSKPLQSYECPVSSVQCVSL